MPHTPAHAVAVVAGRSVRFCGLALVGVLLAATLGDPGAGWARARAGLAAASHQESSPTATEAPATPTQSEASPAPTWPEQPGPSATPTLAGTATPPPTPTASAPPETPDTPPEPTPAALPTAETPTQAAWPVTPTAVLAETPIPTAGATATPYAGDPPLELVLRADSPQVAPGGGLVYQLQLSSTRAAQQGVLVLITLDPHLSPLGATASDGQCQLGVVVVCTTRVRRGEPVSIQIELRVRADVQAGQVLVSQASARDTDYNAASSEPVGVTVIGPQELRPGAPAPPTPAPTATPAAPTPARQQPTAPAQGPPAAASGQITGTVIELGSGAPVPGVGVRIGERVAHSDADGNYRLAGLEPGDYQVELALEPGQGQAAQPPLTLTLGSGATVVQHLMFRAPSRPPAPSVAPTLAAPTLPSTAGSPSRPSEQSRAATSVPRHATALLPDTASVPAAAAATLALIGAALLIRALRRVRHAGAQLEAHSHLAAQLGPLLRAAQRRQRKLRQQIEEGLRAKGETPHP